MKRNRETLSEASDELQNFLLSTDMATEFQVQGLSAEKQAEFVKSLSAISGKSLSLITSLYRATYRKDTPVLADVMTNDIFQADKKYIEIGLWHKLASINQKYISTVDSEIFEAQKNEKSEAIFNKNVDMTKALFEEFKDDIEKMRTGNETEFEVQQFIEALTLGSSMFFQDFEITKK